MYFNFIYIYIFFILFVFVKCYLHAFRYCILGILHILYFTHLFLGMFVKRLKAILIIGRYISIVLLLLLLLVLFPCTLYFA